MTPGAVYAAVTELPANTANRVNVTDDHRVKRALFADALLALVKPEDRTKDFTGFAEALSGGSGYAGSAASNAVKCGADPIVVVTIARLLLT